MFTAIEHTILAHDSSSGDCKCRSYPAEASNHTHLLIEISMLTKPHRDEAFKRTRRNRSHGQTPPDPKLLYLPGHHIFRRHVPNRPARRRLTRCRLFARTVCGCDDLHVCRAIRQHRWAQLVIGDDMLKRPVKICAEIVM